LRDLISLFEKSNYYRWFFQGEKNWGQQVDGNIEKNSIAVIEIYEAHVRQVKALAEEYGFSVFFFWQPNHLA